jgi:dipeptide transport system substrate-binding protein
VNIDVQIDTVDWPQYAQYAIDSKDELILYGWNGDMADPDNFFHTLLSCEGIGLTNLANFCDPTYEKFVQAARDTSQRSVRADLYKKAQIRFKELAPWMPISHSVAYKVVRRNVTGIVMSPTGRNYFYKANLQDM